MHTTRYTIQAHTYIYIYIYFRSAIYMIYAINDIYAVCMPRRARKPQLNKTSRWCTCSSSLGFSIHSRRIGCVCQCPMRARTHSFGNGSWMWRGIKDNHPVESSGGIIRWNHPVESSGWCWCKTRLLLNCAIYPPDTWSSRQICLDGDLKNFHSSAVLLCFCQPF